MSSKKDQVELFIPRLSLSLNQWQRLHWRDRARLKSVWEQEFMAAVADVPTGKRPAWLKPAQGKRRVHVTRFSRGTLDTDNLLGGLKPVLDAMTRQKLLEDDRPGLLLLEASQQKAAGRQGLLVVISQSNNVEKGETNGDPL